MRSIIFLMVGMVATSAQPSSVVRTTVTLSAAGAARAMSEAESLAIASKAPSAIAVSDDSGLLLSFVRMDGARPGSIELAIGKARAAALMRRPTSELEENVAGGRIALATAGLTALRGGVPIMVDGTCVGAIGVAGLNKDQDAVIAARAAAVVTGPAEPRP
jgi:glc operon protein GlcG